MHPVDIYMYDYDIPLYIIIHINDSTIIMYNNIICTFAGVASE